MKTDVTILGGGLAGLTLARQLSLQVPDAEVIVLEQASFPVPERTHKIGESFVELAAHYLGEVLGLRAHLLEEHVPKLGLRFFFRSDAVTPIAERLEYGVFRPPGFDPEQAFAGLPVPGYQVDRGRLENHLAGLVSDRLKQRRVEKVELETDGPHRVTLDGGDVIHSRWVIDATGRRRMLARQMGLGVELPHSVEALWARVSTSLRVEAWTDSAEFAARPVRPGLRHFSTNHLVGPGYWVWLIPLPDGATSVGLLADRGLAPVQGRASIDAMLDFLRPREPELAEALANAPVEDVHYLRSTAYRTERTYSRDRWAVTGEAALHLDPLYSPGADFIAIGNTLITRLIEADLEGRPLGGRARISELVLGQLVDSYLEQYRGAYPMMGAPVPMAHKVLWDSALYFGTHALLFRNGHLGYPDLVGALKPELEKTRDLHWRAQVALRRWSARERSPARGYLPHAEIDFLCTLGFRLEPERDLRDLCSTLRDNLARLEAHLGEVLLPASEGRPYQRAIRGS